jgi:rare lipoprotein A (peptidoglycan hydrolase)
MRRVFSYAAVVLILFLGPNGTKYGAGMVVSAMNPVQVGATSTVDLIEGLASWYGHDWDGRTTANMEIYDADLMTCAHRDLPFDSIVRVWNLVNNKKVELRVNDRGPYFDTDKRVIDVSLRAAQRLGFGETGLVPVRIEVVRWGRGGQGAQKLLPRNG